MVLLFLFLTPSWAANGPMGASVPVVAPSEQERNKAVARRVFEDIFNHGKFDVANEIYAPDFVNHGLHRDVGLKEDQAAARWEKEAMPDIHISVDMMVAEGDKVTALWRAQGTNNHAAGWLPATGVKIEERGITIWRIVNGRIQEEWTAFDVWRIIRHVVSQLMWPLLGLLALLVLLVWLVVRLLRRLIRRMFRRPNLAST
jgi:steroid delta-isomerase-like uncharacterized protein